MRVSWVLELFQVSALRVMEPLWLIRCVPSLFASSRTVTAGPIAACSAIVGICDLGR